MGKSSSKPLRLVHDNQAATLATWFKAIVLFPPWGLFLLAPFGAICRQIHFEMGGLVLAIVFGLCLFVQDLMYKRVTITDSDISCGFGKVKFSQLKRIDIGRNTFKLPVYLMFWSDERCELVLDMTRLLADDALETLLDTLQRRAPQARIDAGVERILQYRRGKNTQGTRDTGSTISISYHPNRAWEGLPTEFRRILAQWSRVLGPVGVLSLASPIWFSVVFGIYSVVRDFSQYEQNKSLYDYLIGLIGPFETFQLSLIGIVSQFTMESTQHPVLLFCGVIMMGLACIGMSKSIVGANRVTIDRTEISLDQWMSLASVNLGAAQWSRVTRVALKKEAAKTIILFECNDGHNLSVHLQAIDGKDRPRLLKAIRRFAPECSIEPEVIELLEPAIKKSYTQLWLQSLTSAPNRKKLEPLKAGDLVRGGRFEVVRRLGVGGQGSAYLCFDLSNVEEGPPPVVVLKEVVIPVFVEQVVKERTIDKFVQEAELLERLNVETSDVVKLLDYFVDDHRAYLVLEHLDGTSCRDLVSKSGPMPASKVEELAVKMCSMLSSLHHHDVIHRDFTADNLILQNNGHLTLIDFNVAQQSDTGITDTIVGKHAYVPPEQFRGRPCKQSDLYAFGATLFYLLTGQDPEPLSQSILPAEHEASGSLLDELVRACTAIELTERCPSIESALQILRPTDINNSSTVEVGEDASSEEADGERIKVRDRERAFG